MLYVNNKQLLYESFCCFEAETHPTFFLRSFWNKKNFTHSQRPPKKRFCILSRKERTKS